MQRLRMLRGRPARSAQRRAQNHRNFPRSARHVMHFGRLVHHLIHRQREEVAEHDVDNGPQSGHRRANTYARETRL